MGDDAMDAGRSNASTPAGDQMLRAARVVTLEQRR
jgi:hypothetical protein